MENTWILFDHLHQDPVMRAVLSGDRKAAMRHLVGFAEQYRVRGSVLVAYVCRLMAGDDNVFSRTVEQAGRCGASLEALARTDLNALRELVLQNEDLLPDYQPTEAIGGDRYELPAYTQSLLVLARAMGTSDDAVFSAVTEHYRTLGRGVSARHAAMGWAGELLGVSHPDPIRLDDLIGVDHQKDILVENTERFLRGAGANNVLLFGDSGTGKSSSVKALVNRYEPDGLRLVELGKDQLHELERVLAILSESRHRYLVFMDDLSFEEGELGYKHLKAALEGKASVTPENVLFYATSNRRHLIRESWADRVTESEEVHISDTMQEKLSLSERFGLRVVFPSPSQRIYLDIVASYLEKSGIPFTDTVRAEALRWEITYNGRSGRTARQFVRSLEGNGQSDS